MQQQNRELERVHKRIAELADRCGMSLVTCHVSRVTCHVLRVTLDTFPIAPFSERMEQRLADMRSEMETAASAAASTIRKLHAQVIAQAKQ